MLDTDDRVIVLDFGIARFLVATNRSSKVMGTLAYMPPERFDDQPGDARSDLYSLGCVLHELLTSHVPFDATDPLPMLNAHLRTPPAPPSTVRSEVPGDVDDIVLALLAKDPADRPANAHRVRELLRAARSHTAARIPHRRTQLPTSDREPFLRPLDVADSITQPAEKAEAMRVIAKAAPWLADEIVRRLPALYRAEALLIAAAGTTDAASALRLAEQAEPLVTHDSEADESWPYAGVVRALTALAGSLADADPADASRVMQSVESIAVRLPPNPKYPFGLFQSLVKIAVVGHDADPYCYWRLLDLAEQTALAVHDHNGFASRAIAVAVAPVDPDRARRAISMIPNEFVRHSAWAHAIKAAARVNHNHAMYLLDTAEQTGATRLIENYLGLRLLAEAAAVVADTARAERIAAQIPVPATRALTLAGMAVKIHPAAPDQARRWLETALRTEGRATWAMSTIIKATKTIAPELAGDAVRHLIATLSDNEDADTLTETALSVAPVDPNQAVRLVDLAEDHAQPPNDLYREWRARALVVAATVWATADPRRAQALIHRAWQITRRPPVLSDTESVWHPLAGLAAKDWNASSPLIDQLPGPDRDPLLSRIAGKLTETDPDRAEHVAQTITNESLCKKNLVKATIARAQHIQNTNRTSPSRR